MRRADGAFFAGMALMWCAPAAAIAPAPTGRPPATKMNETEYRVLLGKALELARQDDCPGLLALLDPALPRIGDNDRLAAQLLRIQCLDTVGRGGEIAGIYREMIAIEPDNPMVRSVGVFTAASGADFVEAGKRLATLAEDSPGRLSAITAVLAGGILQDLNQEQQFALRDRLYLALARADWQPTDRPDMRESLAQGAIEALLAKKDVDEASTLLPRIHMPELLVAMATERSYAPLWPAIEARLGPHGGKAIDPYAAARLDDFTRTPTEDRTVRDAVRAFILLGRYPEASEIGSQVPVAAGMSEDAVTTVRYDSQALAAQGQRAAAAARLEPFAMLDVAGTPAAVSGLVALAETLDENGQEAAALDAARAALERSGPAISPWGVAWLRRTQACALSALGRRQEGNRIGDVLAAKSKDNEAATIEALLCLGRAEEAAQLAITTLRTADGASALADQFQPAGAFWAPSASRLRALWAALLTRPDVKAAFHKSARILPRPLWPAREPRPIPRTAGTGPLT